ALFIAISIGGCYTQIKLTKPSEKTHKNWEDSCSRRYHEPCRWCSGWHYYYYYPWWLDQIWWWEKYSDEPEIERRRERFERRRGLGTAFDAIIRGLERIGDDDDSDDSDDDDDDENHDGNNERENRPERRRGL
ncbi:hypothetical protein DRQ36_01155, partial [bacterium]